MDGGQPSGIDVAELLYRLGENLLLRGATR